MRLEGGDREGDKNGMRLSSFRSLLRIVELVTPIIEEVSSICRRVERSWKEGEKNEHYSLLLQEYLKT